MRPQIEKNGFIDISKGSSDGFNKFLRTITRDIVSAFNKLRDSEDSIDSFNKAMTLENIWLKNKINEIQSDMSNLKNEFNSLTDKDEKFNLRIPFVNGSNLINDNSYFDAGYKMVTLPYVDVQKTTMQAYPKEFLAKNTSISIKYEVFNGSIKESEGVMDQTSGLINIVDSNDYSIWLDSIKTSNLATKVRFTVSINLPAKILTSLYVNSIGIKPHPPYCLDLISAKIIDADTKAKIDIAGFDSTNVLYKPIYSMDNAKMIFPAKKVAAIELVFDQQAFIDHGEKREWLIGFKGIDIEHMKLTSETSSFIVQLDCPGGHYFKQVSQPKVISGLTENVSINNNCKFELLYEPGDETAFEFDTDIPTNRSTVYLKCTMNKSDVIPAISGIEVKYSIK